jgi:hypothetical protein
MDERAWKLVQRGIAYGFIANFIIGRLYPSIYEISLNFKDITSHGINALFPFGYDNLAYWLYLILCGGVLGVIPSISMGGLLGFMISKQKISFYRHLLSVGAGLGAGILIVGIESFFSISIGGSEFQIGTYDLGYTFCLILSFYIIGSLLTRQLSYEQ